MRFKPRFVGISRRVHQCQVNESYIIRGVKLIIMSTIFFVLNIVSLWFNNIIYRVLRKNEKTMVTPPYLGRPLTRW